MITILLIKLTNKIQIAVTSSALRRLRGFGRTAKDVRNHAEAERGKSSRETETHSGEDKGY